MEQIYVELLHEGTKVFRPISAIHMRDMIFKIEDDMPEDETWAFLSGEIVECGYQKLSGGTCLVAFRSLPLEKKGKE